MSTNRPLYRLLPLALAATLAGCFGHDQRPDDDSESFWSTEAETPAPAPASAPEYEVAHGDTLYMIAFRRGLDWRELASLNHIAAPYTIYVGQHLKLGPEPPPAPVAKAQPAPSPQVPVANAEPAPAAPAGGDGVETYAVRESAPAQPTAPASPSRPPEPTPAKPAPAPAEAAEGGSLTRAIRGTPASSASKQEPPAEAAAKNDAPAPAAAPSTKPVTVASAAPPAQPASPPPPAPATGPERNAGGANWRWPAQGTLVGRFLPGDPARQGINVQGKPGATVSAAADGEVVYSGNGLVGYGELIIVKHSGELLSAYGGSGKRLVAEGTKVRSGQPLAELAGNGIVHFEIRRSGKPVDPLEYLPNR